MPVIPNRFYQFLLFVIAATLLLPTQGTPADIAAATRPEASVTGQQLARARRLREALYGLMPASGDPKDWPDHLSSNEGGTLVYTKPVDRKKIGLGVTLRETFEQFPDGIRVADSDGALQWLQTRAELAEREAEPAIASPAISQFGGIIGQQMVKEVDPNSLADQLKGELTLDVVDEQNKPVAGAAAGVIARFGDRYGPDGGVWFYDNSRMLALRTDGAGKLKLPATRVFSPNGKGSTFLDVGAAPLYLYDAVSDRCALTELALKDFAIGSTRKIVLRASCHVRVELISLTDEMAASPVTNVFAFAPGRELLRGVFGWASQPAGTDLPLPQGDWGVGVGTHDFRTTIRLVHVEAGRREITLRLALDQQARAAVLLGKAAPAIQGIKGWKNSPPLSLAELRGKVVILDFWGYWCGPCCGAMPELMRIYDMYKDRGLVVIGVHDDSVESIAEMDEKLVHVREKAWHGRAIPFPVALDGGGNQRIQGTGAYARGKTTAAYHVTTFPTTLLIGADGLIQAQLDIDEREKPRAVNDAAIEKALRGTARGDIAEPATRPKSL